MRNRYRTFGLALLIGLPLFVHGGPAGAEHLVVPIRQFVNPDGKRRFGIAMSINGQDRLLGLDTGSVGLRLLNAEREPAGQPLPPYDFASGVRLFGRIAHAKVAHPLNHIIDFEAITSVGCEPDRPNCPARQLAPGQFRLMGDGYASIGFDGIIGLNMAEGAIPNPVIAAGFSKWSLTLPHLDSAAPGELILDPDTSDLKDTRFLPIVGRYASMNGALHDAVRACIIGGSPKETICGVALLDTGTNGITVRSARQEAPWTQGSAAELRYGTPQADPIAIQRIVVGSRAQAARVTFLYDPKATTPIIYTGISPYLSFHIVYDPARGAIGFKENEPSATNLAIMRIKFDGPRHAGS